SSVEETPAMSSSVRPAPHVNPLHRRLAGLRRQLLLTVTVRGLSLFLAVLLGVAVVGGLLDYSWHLPALIRALVLVLALCGGGYVAYRFLLRPLAAPRDDLALALRVEDRYPSLNDSLASAVQFLEQPEDSGGPASPSLRREAVRRALGHAEGFDFTRVVDT